MDPTAGKGTILRHRPQGRRMEGELKAAVEELETKKAAFALATNELAQGTRKLANVLERCTKGGGAVWLSACSKGDPMDFWKFCLSAEGRVNRKQFWLWLILPLTAIGVLLAMLDVATGKYDPQLGLGLFSGIFALASLIPS